MALPTRMVLCGVLAAPALLSGCALFSSDTTPTLPPHPEARTATSPPNPSASPYSQLPHEPIAQIPKPQPPVEPRPPERPVLLPSPNVVTAKPDTLRPETNAVADRQTPDMKNVSVQPVLPVDYNKKPSPPDKALTMAVRHQEEGRPDLAVEDLKGYPAANQELLLGMLALAVRLTDGNVEKANPREVSQLLEQLDGLEATLRARAPLTLNHLCFCRHQPGYARYERWPGNEFRAGNGTSPGDMVWVYAELANATARRQGEFYVTNLASRFSIRNAGDKEVLSSPPEKPTIRPTHGLVHDQYVSYMFEVPKEMPPGPYTVTIEVEDLMAQPHRSTKASLDFYLSPHGADLTSRGGASR